MLFFIFDNSTVSVGDRLIVESMSYLASSAVVGLRYIPRGSLRAVLSMEYCTCIENF